MPAAISVELHPYNPAWAGMARDLAAQLADAMKETLVAVHHIGSTAIPGIAAKPVLDLMLVVTSLAALDTAGARVASLGYEWHGEYGIPGRRYCTLAAQDGRRLAQLHCFAHGSPHIRRHLAFRDYLHAHPPAARAYEAEKMRCRDLHPHDSHAYGDAKAGWIARIEAEALAAGYPP